MRAKKRSQRTSTLLYFAPWNPSGVMPSLDQFLDILSGWLELRHLSIVGWGPCRKSVTLIPKSSSCDILSIIFFRICWHELLYAVKVFSLFDFPSIQNLIWSIFKRLTAAVLSWWYASLWKNHDLRFWYIYQAKGLENITSAKTAEVMQVSESNPMVGIEGRTSLHFNLGMALKTNALVPMDVQETLLVRMQKTHPSCWYECKNSSQNLLIWLIFSIKSIQTSLKARLDLRELLRSFRSEPLLFGTLL